MDDKTKDQKKQGDATFEQDACVPFDHIEDMWFWFIAAQQARNEGARYASGAGLVRRPCEPVDILKILDGLYRKRRLLRDHLLVLRHYGRRHLAPDPTRVKEARAFYLWREALERMRPVLEAKGIIRRSHWSAHYTHHDGCALPTFFPEFEGVAAE
tara:strand:+ start:203 stop:670 length:468 start_codon:yes stop_codon:yes gene_type:complete